MAKIKFLAPMMLCTVLIGGCAMFSPYSQPVQQGKILTSPMIKQVKAGMTENQVKYILGSPDIIDPFAPNRYNYVYTYQRKPSDSITIKRLMLKFNNDKLVSINGNYPPPQEIFGSRATLASK